jgi:hypothetical protein
MTYCNSRLSRVLPLSHNAWESCDRATSRLPASRASIFFV